MEQTTVLIDGVEVPLRRIEPRRRGECRPRAVPDHGHIVITTQTALGRADDASGEPIGEPMEENDPYALEKMEQRRIARERQDAIGVVLAQPHRRDSPTPESTWLASALGRFCKKQWANDYDLRRACFNAGNDYAKEIREARVARGFFVEGVDVTPLGKGGGDGDLSEEAMEAARLEIEAADAKVAKAREVLVGVIGRLPSAMEALLFASSDEYAPHPHNEGILAAGLWRLACHYGLIDRGINGLRDF